MKASSTHRQLAATELEKINWGVFKFCLLCMLLLQWTFVILTKVYLSTSIITWRCPLNSYRKLNFIFSPARYSRGGIQTMSKRKADEDDKPAKVTKKAPRKKTIIDEIVPLPQLPFIPANFNAARARRLSGTRDLNAAGQCVVLWMSRDQRAEDNHAMLYAQGVATSKGVPLKVVFNMVPKFLNATLRQYDFMITGLREVEEELRQKNIPFYLLMGDPIENIPQFAAKNCAMVVVGDFSPLRVGLSWSNSVADSLDNLESPIPMVQVDAHNVVPCWIASPKLEYGARTIRTKIQNRLPEFLTPFEQLEANPPGSLDGCDPVDWTSSFASLEIDRSIGPVTWITPGTAAARRMLQSFIEVRLKDYGAKRNDPNLDLQSNLSPYIHFGQISVQRLVLSVKSSKKHPSSADSFVEEAVVRSELSDNFCFYNPKYDSLEACNDWARTSLALHASDVRPVLYTCQELEDARTHDDLWNAAQLQMTQKGKMHGFLRMYWAKKILEWSPSPEEALRVAIHLNDKYELDGRDPNGYVGCLWSIGGIHDQGWGERPVFGKIRFMNYEGCKRKFDVPAFVSKYPPAAANAASVSRARKL